LLTGGGGGRGGDGCGGGGCGGGGSSGGGGGGGSDDPLFVIGSDGLFDEIDTASALANAVAAAGGVDDLAAVAASMVKQALGAGSSDNITCVVCRSVDVLGNHLFPIHSRGFFGTTHAAPGSCSETTVFRSSDSTVGHSNQGLQC
jgi:hypothetical protein